MWAETQATGVIPAMGLGEGRGHSPLFWEVGGEARPAGREPYVFCILRMGLISGKNPAYLGNGFSLFQGSSEQV